MRLSELEKTNLVVNIYSEVLDTNICLCSNNIVFEQQIKSNQEIACYTVEELRILNQKNTSYETLIKIHEFKKTFPNSKLIL